MFKFFFDFICLLDSWNLSMKSTLNKYSKVYWRSHKSKQTNQRHFYHLVEQSPWPILMAFSLFITIFGLIFWMHRINGGGSCFIVGFLMFMSCVILWWQDIISESKNKGNHTLIVQRGLKLGFKLFMLSEIMFFFGFFWVFFSSSMSPTVWIANIWPPMGFPMMNPWTMPLLNTIILLVSGLSMTWTHHAIEQSQSDQVQSGMQFTRNLAIFFLFLQYMEYQEALFELSDGIYGSVFYSLTGLHCFHVIIGLIFMHVCFKRFSNGHFTSKHHMGFLFAIWYWHFVDMVWIFLFIFIYVWGNWMPENLILMF